MKNIVSPEDIKLALSQRNRRMSADLLPDNLVIAGVKNRLLIEAARHKRRRRILGVAASALLIVTGAAAWWHYRPISSLENTDSTQMPSTRIIAELESAGYKGKVDVIESNYTTADGTVCYITRVTVSLDSVSRQQNMAYGRPIAAVCSTYDSIVGKSSTRSVSSTELYFVDGAISSTF